MGKKQIVERLAKLYKRLSKLANGNDKVVTIIYEVCLALDLNRQQTTEVLGEKVVDDLEAKMRDALWKK